MTGDVHQEPSGPLDGGEGFEKVVGWALVVIVLALQLVVSPTGNDVFRLPKDLALLASATLLTAGFLAAIALGKTSIAWIPWRTKPIVLVGAILGWSVLTALASTNLPISLGSLRVALATATLFVFAYSFARNYRTGTGMISPTGLLTTVLCASAINGVIMILQTFEIWRPFALEPQWEKHYMGRTAMIGNPNDVGMVLVVPALVAIVLSSASSGRLRLFFAGFALFLFFSLMVNQTRTALIAYLFGFLTLGVVKAGKRGMFLALIPLGVILLVAVLAPGLNRTGALIEAVRTRDVENFTSGRLISFAAAAQMFQDHPLVGTGPGTFGFQYLPYRSAAIERWRSLDRSTNRTVNFGEVHNDHLEILAETGVPGYLLFLSAMVLFASVTFRRTSPAGGELTEPNSDLGWAREAALPVSATVFVLCLAQFPFQLAAPTSVILVTAATVLGRGGSR